MSNDTEALDRWWEALSERDRERARELKKGEALPPEFVVSLSRAGLPQAAPWWPSTEQGPRFTMPPEVVDYVHDQAEEPTA